MDFSHRRLKIIPSKNDVRSWEILQAIDNSIKHVQMKIYDRWYSDKLVQ